ncbi:MAG TPA: hypothetical protein VMR41_01185 [Patescibacteria group bacterium]|nr:hypothetical protein [Patescibacteria group bacterium]
MKDIDSKQEKLQKEGKQILESLQIIQTLSQFGTPEVVGSMTLKTMLYPDIDIVLRKKPIDENAYWQTVKSLLGKPHVEKLLLMDTRESVTSENPHGLYISITYWNGETKWNIDIWFFRVLDPGDPNYYEWIRAHMTESDRQVILVLKEAAIRSGKYKTHIFSTDIYKAVLENNVKNLEDFTKYLATLGKSLG